MLYLAIALIGKFRYLGKNIACLRLTWWLLIYSLCNHLQRFLASRTHSLRCS